MDLGYKLIVVIIPIVFSQNDYVDIDGKQFTLAFFPDNVNPPTSSLDNFLYMSSTEAGSCTVSYNDGTRKTSDSVVHLIPGQVVEKALPDNTQMSNIGTGVETKAIYVNCSTRITLHGYNKRSGENAEAEPFIILPDNLLSNRYVVSGVFYDSFVGIAAIQSNTHVVIRPTCDPKDEHSFHYGDFDAINVTLNYGDVFRFGGTKGGYGDHCRLDSTVVSSDKQISAFSGSLSYPQSHERTSPIVRQLLPESAFSRTIIIPSFKREMRLRILRYLNNTVFNCSYESDEGIVTYERNNTRIYNAYFDIILQPYRNVIIQSSAPVMITSNTESLFSVPGISQYGNNFLVRAFDTNSTVRPDVTVVTESKSINHLMVNGHPPIGVNWTHLSTISYSVGRFQIGDKGTYNISCSSPILVRVDEEVGLQFFSYIAGFRMKNTLSTVVKSAVQLVCHEGAWDVRVDVDKLHLSNSNIPHLYLNTDTCTGTLHGGQLLFNYSYNDCNTQTRDIGGMLVYNSSLVLTDSSPQSPSVSDIWSFDLQCSMPATNSGSVHLHPGHHGHVVGGMAATISESPVHVALYKDNEYRHQLQGPVILVDVGQPVYVQVSTNNQNTVMLVNSCDAHLEEDKHTSLPLIENGCAITSRTKHLISRNQVTRFMFEVFDMKNAKDGIYVTCHVTFCAPMDFSEKCQQGCK